MSKHTPWIKEAQQILEEKGLLERSYASYFAGAMFTLCCAGYSPTDAAAILEAAITAIDREAGL